jgi:single-stranded DNA-binding protein
MAADINACTFTGNVVADPKEFAYGEGKKLARIRLAVNNFGDKPAAYIDLTAFDGLAEKVVLPYVKKGTPITVLARVETRVEDDRGENRTRVGFVVQDLKLGGTGGENANGTQAAPAAGEEPPPF